MITTKGRGGKIYIEQDDKLSEFSQGRAVMSVQATASCCMVYYRYIIQETEMNVVQRSHRGTEICTFICGV